MSEERQLVVFSIGLEEFGVNINEVKEIIRMEQITSIPNTPTHIKGVINLRGSIVVVMDLSMKLGLPVKETDGNTRIIIIEFDDNVVGMIVDSATEVLRISGDDVKPAPSVITDKIDGNYLEGVGVLGDRLLILLDLARIISSKDLASINKIDSTAKVSASKVEIKSEKVEEKVEKEPSKEKVAEEEKEQLKLTETKEEKVLETKEETVKEAANNSKEAHPVLKDVHEDFHFLTHEGDPIANVAQLLDYIKDLDEQTFKVFVNEEKNDFYNWIKFIVKDDVLADKIQHIKNKKDVTAELMNRILEIKMVK